MGTAWIEMMRSLDWFPLRLSFEVPVAATCLSLVVGVSIAWLLARRTCRGKEWLDALMTLPLGLPPTVLGYYLLVLLGQRSPIGRAWEAVFGSQLTFTPQAAVVAATIHALPLMVKSARAAIEEVDVSVENAARLLGADEWRVFVTVTLPLAARSIAAATALAFARALGDFGVTIMIAGNIPHKTQTASVAIYDAVEAGREGYAWLLVIILSTLSLLTLYAMNRLTQKP